MVWVAAVHLASTVLLVSLPYRCCCVYCYSHSGKDLHIELERDIAAFLGTESAIIYSQGFSTISSVIPAFCKRGDIIIADRGVNFAIHLGIKLSRSTVRWYDHNDMESLEEVVQNVAKEVKKKRLPLTRQFIITEGIFENDGALSDLPKLVRFATLLLVIASCG